MHYKFLNVLISLLIETLRSFINSLGIFVQ